MSENLPIFSGFTRSWRGFKRNNEPFTFKTWKKIQVEYNGILVVPDHCQNNHPLTWKNIVELDEGHTWSKCPICKTLTGEEFFGA